MFLPPYQPWVDGEKPWTLTPLTFTDLRTSTNVPEFRRKIKEHRNATSLLSGEKYHYYGGYGSQFGSSYKNFIWGTGYGTQSVTGQLVYIDPTVILPLPAYSGLADNQARSMFWKRAQAAQTAFRSFTFLGELTETLHMIRRPGQSLRRGLDDYVKSVTKRTRRAKRSSLNRIVGDTWLEYVFGWAPLISDIQSAGSALNRRLERFQGSYTKISGRVAMKLTLPSLLRSRIRRLPQS